jgi:hypothetical protein
MPDQPAALAESTLIMIDCQNTYTRGVMELEGVQAALDEAAELLDRARQAGIPIFHIMHEGGADTPYDTAAEIGRIVDRVAPRDGEPVIVKNYPNAFTETDLHQQLTAAPGRDLILAGFMTHMCVNSTARGAFSLGYRPWSPRRRRPGRCRACPAQRSRPRTCRWPAWPPSPTCSASWWARPPTFPAEPRVTTSAPSAYAGCPSSAS